MFDRADEDWRGAAGIVSAYEIGLIQVQLSVFSKIRDAVHLGR